MFHVGSCCGQLELSIGVELDYSPHSLGFAGPILSPIQGSMGIGGMCTGPSSGQDTVTSLTYC